MKNRLRITDDDRWQSVVDRDVDADGQFVFAVQTTGVFCRPSCRAKHALRKNVRFFADAQQAQDAGFRPCKRCQPDKDSAQQHRLDKIARACQLLEQESPLTLDELAQQVAMSPYHLHRLFKATTGMTPKVWQQSWRARRLRDALAKGVPVTQAILNAGFPDSSSYYRKADQALGMTAKQFRKGGDNVSVRYTLADCALGRCLVAESERGICAILLGDDDATLVADLHALFPAAQDVPADANFQQRVREVIVAINSRDAPLSLPLDIRGTAFQQQVWQALRTIPCGETVSYQQLASAIGKPKAVRAVASACGANKLAIVIPCHRVIRGDGALSGYRWGIARKAQLLHREATGEET
ncbi:bifunctional DNA-binding transcriptional regulator/O6-methylguanine-DNA methyltransferase Ada [Citrobacter sp. BNK-39]|uniref:bifunctional DNA-binding transcriptional regulator/O6-methylguanine-DNA methyltransferase Ada n=1 Tax=Citrobacter TaxID=544 RepID=UPI0006512028|nr:MULTISPECIES: bifunctional DNA-binding transcriptional regulator/O6-methylguanine-DNA methyltransferase Ada [Citrobacter freundii complex]EGS5520717.1 bifunctional DNA-binding transcriptional regulator/O6-methylguanine-DNA methyltransferase Ada [Citrobacter freundii]MCY3417995.1 bifunctional DNA-binding transcriptional regulator/O6-methylguanine-DNA methyltransferase Ada [Citrobacter freundii]MDE9608907.1 bifunctional DNA-binding transcriptional regulator/O6-methylguanine-DNA methyltransferas